MDEPAKTGKGAPPSPQTVRTVRRSGAGKTRRVNGMYALLSLVIGCLLWFGVDLKRMVDKTMNIEIELERQLPADWKIMNPDQVRDKAEVVLRGPRQDIENLRADELMVEPDMPAGAFVGDVLELSVSLASAKIRGLPPGVQVQSVTPDAISLRVGRTITKYLTVEAGNIVGNPQEGYAVGKVHQIDPPAMPVMGFGTLLSKIGPADVIRTRDFSIEGGRGLVGGMIALQPFEKDGESIEVPGMVYMSVELEEIPTQREFEQPFEVRALIDAPYDRYSDLNISPPSVKVTVAGPKTVVDKMRDSDIVIYADIRDRIPAAQGEFNLKCRAIVPSRVRVTRIEPDTVKWITREQGGIPAAPSDAPQPRTSEGEAAGK